MLNPFFSIKLSSFIIAFFIAFIIAFVYYNVYYSVPIVSGPFLELKCEAGGQCEYPQCPFSCHMLNM